MRLGIGLVVCAVYRAVDWRVVRFRISHRAVLLPVFCAAMVSNAPRAVAEVIDRLCNRLPALRLFRDIRDSLQIDDGPFPSEFQCLFVVEFTEHSKDVKVEDCTIIEVSEERARR